MGIFIFFKNLCFLSKFINFFSSESGKFILFEFYYVRAGARTRARQFYFECWKFTENSKIGKFSENVILARARARMIKSEKYELSAFTGKKLLNLDKNSRFWRKSKFVNSNFFEAFFKNDMSSQNANKICIKMTLLVSKNS